MTNYRRGRHSVSLLYTHLVFVTKYRRRIFNQAHLEAMREYCNNVARRMDFKLLEFSGEAEHAHLLIEYPPKLAVSQIVNTLKGVSSRMLRKEFPELTPHKDHLWSPSYFAISCGGAPIEKITEYIRNQEKPS